MVQAGTTIYFSYRSYSNYTIVGHARVLAEFDYESEKAAYIYENLDRTEPVPEEWKSYPWYNGKTTHQVNPRSISGFMTFLVQRGLIEEIDAEEFFDGDSSLEALALILE